MVPIIETSLGTMPSDPSLPASSGSYASLDAMEILLFFSFTVVEDSTLSLIYLVFLLAFTIGIHSSEQHVHKEIQPKSPAWMGCNSAGFGSLIANPSTGIMVCNIPSQIMHSSGSSC